MKVVLSSPAYGPVEPEHRDSILNAVMFAAHHGVEWRGALSTNRQSWEEARNHPTRVVMEMDDDTYGIMWVDSDMLVPMDAFARLITGGDDLVSGLYFQREPPYWPNAYKYDPKLDSFRRLSEWKPNDISPLSFGFGVCFTSMKLLRDMPKDPFKFDKYSEDLGFCRAAMDAGYTPKVDTGVICQHHRGPRWVGENDFRRWKARFDKIEGNEP